LDLRSFFEVLGVGPRGPVEEGGHLVFLGNLCVGVGGLLGDEVTLDLKYEGRTSDLRYSAWARCLVSRDRLD
jgi:hypothetical protein